MADFSALKTAIQANIRTNGNEEITGAILQDILLSMVTTMGDGAINALAEALQAEITNRQNAVSGEATTRAEADSQLSGRINSEAQARSEADSQLSGRINSEAQARSEADTQLGNSITAITTRLNEGYVYAGIATPSTNPGTPAGKVFYIALQAGTYTNFSSLTVTQGITILKYNGTAWSKEQLVAIDDVPTAGSNNLVKSGGVFANIGAFDISEYNKSGSTLATYADLTAALAALPSDFQKGGMSIKFVQSSDNKYAQFRLMNNTWSINTSDWALYSEDVLVDNPEFVYVKNDAQDKILWAIKKDGSIHYGAGVPPQVVEYIQQKIDELGLDKCKDIVAFLDGLEESDKTLQQLLDEKLDSEGLSRDALSTISEMDNPEWMQVTTDAKSKILEGITAEGKKKVMVDVEYPNGIPSEIKEYVDAHTFGDIDSEMDANSHNPVQNEAITKALFRKADISEVGNIVGNYIDANIQGQVASYLRDNIDDFQVVNPNVLVISTLSQLQALSSSDSGKTYSIMTDINLNGNTIDLEVQGAKDITFVFDGGVISNGYFTPNDTTCVFNFMRGFSGVTINRRFKNKEVDVRCLGAACDGVDNGISDFTHDDSSAIMQAMAFSQKVIIPKNCTSIVKSSIVIPSNTELCVEGTLKLGAAANCHLLITKAVNLNRTSGNLSTIIIPSNFVKDSHITISGHGTIDGNGWMQNRHNTIDEAGTGIGDNPDVINTELRWVSYPGNMMVLDCVDYLEIKDVRLRNARTFTFAIADVVNFKIHDIIIDRTFYRNNGDGCHIYGKCFDGEIYNVKGDSTDDFIAICPHEYEIWGNVKRIHVHDITYWGISQDATPENPIELEDYNGIESNNLCHRLMRVSTTDEFVDSILIENCALSEPKTSAIVISNLPFGTSTSGYGTGSFGTIIIRNIVQKSTRGLVTLSDYTVINNLIIEDITENRVTENVNMPGGLISWGENFVSGATDRTCPHSLIRNLTIRNVLTKKGNAHYNVLYGFISFTGTIERAVIDNYMAYELDSSAEIYNEFIHVNCNYLQLSNCDFRVFSSPVALLNSDCELYEYGNIYAGNVVSSQATKRANTNTLLLSTNPTNPVSGDMIRKADGTYQYKGGSWV